MYLIQYCRSFSARGLHTTASSAFTSTSRGNLSTIEGLSALTHFLQLASQIVRNSW